MSDDHLHRATLSTSRALTCMIEMRMSAVLNPRRAAKHLSDCTAHLTRAQTELAAYAIQAERNR